MSLEGIRKYYLHSRSKYNSSYFQFASARAKSHIPTYPLVWGVAGWGPGDMGFPDISSGYQGPSEVRQNNGLTVCLYEF